MKWKSLLAAALTAAVAWPALAQETGGTTASTDGTVISLSFANGRAGQSEIIPVSEGDTPVGLAPVPGNQWTNLSQSGVNNDNKAISVTDAAVSAAYDLAESAPVTLPVPVKVSFSAKNAWSILGKQSNPTAPSILHAYLDDGDPGASVTVKDIPFSSYDVIVYFATDNAKWTSTDGVEGSDGSPMQFQPVTVNGTLYSWQNGALVSGDAATNVLFGQSLQDTVAEGTNALRIPSLTGATLTIQGGTGFIDGNYKKGRGCIAAVQIVEVKPSFTSFNINFAQTADDPYDVPDSGAYGLASVPGTFWQNIYGSSGTDVPLSLEAYGLHTDAKMTFNAPGTWRFPNDGQVTDPILTGFLGVPTNASNGSTVTVTDIPFTQYDVIVYFATNEENAVFQPVTINDKSYTWSTESNTTVEGDTTFGASRGTVSEYGRNALRITGLMGDLSLKTGAQTIKTETEPFKTGNLCGIQIVCTGEVTDAAVPLERNPTISVNFARGRGNGNPIVRDVTRLETQAFAVVPAGAWVNLYPSSTDCDDTVTLSTIWNATLSTPVRVSYQANGTWSDNVEGRPAFLKTFLGDGAYGNKIGADILVSQIPFSEYEAIVYLATDTTSAQFLPVEINDTLYKGNGTDATVEAATITDTYGDSSVLTPTEGVNVIRVGGLSGDLRIKGSTQIRSNDVLTGRCNIAAFQIVCTGEVIDPEGPDRGVISLNYASGTNNAAVPDTAQLYGLEAAPGTAWADLTGAPASTQNFTAAYGASIGQMSTTFSAGGTYQYGADQNVNPFMRGYLDDNSGDNGYNHVSISVPNIPFDLYDVIVYTAVQLSDQDFKPVQVNGTYYTFDDAANGDWRTEAVEAGGASFGQGNQPIAKIGVNAIRVNNQDAQELSVNGQSGGDGHRGGIAAIQIIERPVQEITVNTETTAQKVFAQSLPGRVPKLVFAEGGAITGAVNLSGVAVDLSQVTTLPFSGNLTVNANTKLYLPNVRTYTLTTGTVTGTLAAGNVFVGGTAIPADAMTQNGANLIFNVEVSYNWTGAAGDNLWSNPANWSSHAVPTAEADVSIPLAAGDKVTIELPADAVAKSVTITGPESGTATLALTSAAGETGLLTISGQMLTTGNVTVTQSANITVNGATQTGMIGSYGPFAIQTGFQVNGSGATYTVASGALEVGWQGTDGAGDVSVSNEATLEVGKAGSLYAAQAIASYFGNATSAASGTLSIAGTATFSTQMGLRTDKFTVKLVGGTMTTPSVRTFNGLTVSEASTPSVLKAPDGLKMSVSGTNSALTGEGNLTLQGAVAFSSAITADYTGVLTAAANSTVTLGENRPNLSVVEGATVIITPTAAEQAAGVVSFGTSMADAETVTGVTFTVAGVESVSAEVADGKLTLKWESAMPTLATSGDWSASNWTVGEATGQAAPTSGTVVLDGTAEGGITVTLDTAIPEEITSIILRGDVTLVTSEAQGTIPASVTFGENVVLTVGAVQFTSGWTLPAGATLKVTDATTSLFGLTLNGVVELAFSGTTETSATYSAPVSFFGGLTVSGSDVSITDVQLLGDAETRLTGDNVSLTFSGTSFYTRTTLINAGTGNKLLNIQNLNGEILANAGTLTLEVALVLNEETSPEENPVYVQNVAPVFKGLTIAEGATVTFTGVGTGGQFAVTGAGTLDMGTFRKQLAGRDGTLVKNLRVTATDDEQKAGEIRFLVQGSPALPEGFQVVVTPAEGAAAWKPTWDLNGQNLVITNTATVVSTISGTGRKLWSATTSWDGSALPTEGEVVIEGGTSGNGLIVYLDTAIPEGITSITVRGKVSLQTSAVQPTLPLDILHVEEETTLGLEFFGNNVTQDISSLNVNGGLLLSGDNVTLTAGTISGTLAISPATHNGKSDTVRISGDNSTLNLTGVASGSGVAVTGPGNTLNIGTFGGSSILTLVQGTNTAPSLTLNTCTGLAGADIQSGTTLKLAASWNGVELHATGDGYLDMTLVAAENRPTLARWGSTLTTLPKTIQVTASEAENTAGKVELDLVVPSGNNDTAYVTLPEGFVAQVTYGLAHWEVASTVISEDHSKLVITKAAPDVSPSLPEGSTLSEAATAALNTAAEQAGITGEYDVAITTGGETVTVTTAEAATQLQEVLECFTGLTLKATVEGGNMVTVVYDFGVVGVKRNTADNGWVVTAQVQGAPGAAAGFAEGNVYTLTVNGAPAADASATVGENGTVTFTVPDASVAGETCTLGVKVSRPEQTPAQ